MLQLCKLLVDFLLCLFTCEQLLGERLLLVRVLAVQSLQLGICVCECLLVGGDLLVAVADDVLKCFDLLLVLCLHELNFLEVTLLTQLSLLELLSVARRLQL